MVVSTAQLGLALSTIGELILAITVLTVHYKVKKEHKIDQYVINEITHEEIAGVISISLIIIGFVLQVSTMA